MRLRVLLTLTALSLCVTSEASFAKTGKKQAPEMKDTYDMRTAAIENEDPWAGFNHPLFDFNLFFDRNVFKPLIQAYDYSVPFGVRHSIDNFLTNLTEPLNAIHGVLQLNPKIAFTSVWRFILNTTFGLGGFDDFAGKYGNLNNMDQDLGKTLGRWGVPAGPYLVLPIVGPSSLRDTTGRIGDWFADPIGWAETPWLAAGHAVVDGIDARDVKAPIVDKLYYESLDPYVATRSAYRQHERFEETSHE